MPAMAMLHDEDPKDAILRRIGSVADFEVFHNDVLVAVYVRPQKTRSGIYLTDKTVEEDRYQGKVGLVLKLGDKAFQNTPDWSWPDKIEVGDWVVFRPSEGWAVTLNANDENLCRVLADTDVRLRVQHPDQVW